MFDYISGIVRFCSQNQIVVDVSGVGFSILVPNHVKNKLTDGENAKIFVYLYVRDDSIKLYGFLSEQEREMFLRLQSISGIGPALALNIIAAGNLQKLYESIMSEDVEFFRTIKGIGSKMASRIVLELKGSLKNIDLPGNSEDDFLRSAATKALANLGYQEFEAAEAVKKSFFQEKPKNLENLVRHALQILQSK